MTAISGVTISFAMAVSIGRVGLTDEYFRKRDTGTRPDATGEAVWCPDKNSHVRGNPCASLPPQELIKKIELDYGRRLICYVSGRSATIDRDDTVGFVELLHNISPDEDVDLLIHTRGGDVDAAEKMLSLVQATVGERQLRLIIPEFAKSAGTLMALGADTLLMSDLSELGTIDPQIWADDGQGNMVCHSVLSYIDAYTTHAAALAKNPDDPVARLMLSKLDPTTC